MSLQNLDLIALKSLDLTSLNDTDDEQGIRALIANAQTPFGHVAAICIYSRFLEHAAELLQGSTLKLATVVNFPNGNDTVESVVAQTEQALMMGANEIDVVLPYQSFIKGDRALSTELLKATRAACSELALKVIIESGELQSESLIRSASELAIECGADFVKTSTGKTPVSATVDSVEYILRTLQQSTIKCGLKISGGVKTSTDAQTYLRLVASHMGPDWITPEHFRFGASSLLTNLLNVLKGQPQSLSKGY